MPRKKKESKGITISVGTAIIIILAVCAIFGGLICVKYFFLNSPTDDYLITIEECENKTEYNQTLIDEYANLNNEFDTFLNRPWAQDCLKYEGLKLESCQDFYDTYIIMLTDIIFKEREIEDNQITHLVCANNTLQSMKLSKDNFSCSGLKDCFDWDENNIYVSVYMLNDDWLDEMCKCTLACVTSPCSYDNETNTYQYWKGGCNRYMCQNYTIEVLRNG